MSNKIEVGSTVKWPGYEFLSKTFVVDEIMNGKALIFWGTEDDGSTTSVSIGELVLVEPTPEYTEGQKVWYKGEKWTIQTASTQYAHIVQYPKNPIGRQVNISDLSPNPPVKEEDWKPCIGKFAYLTENKNGFRLGEKVLVIHITPENDFCLVQNELDTHSDYVLYEDLSKHTC